VVLDVLDGDFGRQEADLYLDQNLGAEHAPFDGPEGSVRLAGMQYALLREVVRENRPTAPRPTTEPAVFDIVAFFGGTDAHDAAPVVVPLLLQTGVAMQVRVVAGRSKLARQLAVLPTEAGQRIEVLEPTDDLPRLAAASDLVVCASGTSLWEMLCVGAPSAILAVTRNQEIGYQAVVTGEFAVGLGRLDQLCTDDTARVEAVRSLATLLRNPERRARLSDRGWALVDGRGRERVAEALLGVARPA
jgi:spore coat polysaccharide biosynthesis predicted glycosyltransferase SpsG